MRLPQILRRGGGAGIAVVTCLLVACANSPSDDLARTQTDLIRLEQQGVVDYLPGQIAAVKENLRVARDCIEHNRFELASGPLSVARATLDSCAAALVSIRSAAKSKSEATFSQIQNGLDSLATLLKAMPRRSYLEQNLYGLHSMKLREMRQKAVAMRESIGRNDYPDALKQGHVLERHLRKSLVAVQGNLPEAMVAVSDDEMR